MKRKSGDSSRSDSESNGSEAHAQDVPGGGFELHNQPLLIVQAQYVQLSLRALRADESADFQTGGLQV